MSRKRLVDIDRAKGVAIFLVVVGHLFTLKSVPEAHHWCNQSYYTQSHEFRRVKLRASGAMCNDCGLVWPYPHQITHIFTGARSR